MFFTNHRSNTEAGFYVNTEFFANGEILVSVAKDLDEDFDRGRFASDDGVDGTFGPLLLTAEEKAIEWAKAMNYIVGM